MTRATPLPSPDITRTNSYASRSDCTAQTSLHPQTSPSPPTIRENKQSITSPGKSQHNRNPARNENQVRNNLARGRTSNRPVYSLKSLVRAPARAFEARAAPRHRGKIAVRTPPRDLARKSAARRLPSGRGIGERIKGIKAAGGCCWRERAARESFKSGIFYS